MQKSSSIAPTHSRAVVTSNSLRHPVIFLHLQKTAGSAIRHYLGKSIARQHTLNELSDEREVAESLARYTAMTTDEQEGLKVIFGHQAKVFRTQFPNAPLATIVRNPFDRAMSQYFYERRHVRDFNWRKEDRPLPHEVTLKEFMDGFLAWGTFDDPADKTRRSPFQLQTRTIADFLDVPFETLTVEDIPDLINKFDFIGLQDEFALSAFLFCRRYDLPARPIPFVNSFSDLTKPYFPRSFVRDVQFASALDMKLYELTCERFEKEAAYHFSDQSEWGLWNSYRSATEKEIKLHLVHSLPSISERLAPPESHTRLTKSAGVGPERMTLLKQAVRNVLGLADLSLHRRSTIDRLQQELHSLRVVTATIPKVRQESSDGESVTKPK